MMKKFIFTLVAIICCAISTSYAQEDRNPIYVIVLENVQYAHSNEKQSTGESVHKIMTALATGKTAEQLPQYEKDVIAGIVQGLSGARRYRFAEEFLPEDSVQEGNVAVDALITNIYGKSETRTSTDKKGNTSVTTTYDVLVEARLTFKDLKTGRVMNTQSFDSRDNLFTSSSSQDQAFRHAINSMIRSITRWLNKQQPLQANVTEGAKVKKDKQKEVNIDLGSREGAVAGMHFEVYLTKTIEGKETRQKIGKLKIETVEGDNISRCKVQRGAKEIKDALDAGDELKVISID